MLKSLKIAGEGLKAQLVRNDIIANNLANVTSSGFKKILARFSREASGELAISSSTDFSPGNLKRTDNPFDLALKGEGFFVVETPQGERYTRCGSFSFNESGTLVTLAGHPVLASEGQVTVAPEDRVEVGRDGSITVNGLPRFTLRIVKCDDVSALVREGAELYRAEPGAPLHRLGRDEVAVLPGFIEESNVNPLREMVGMITALRTYGALEKSLQSADEILDVAINQVARVPAGRG